MIVKALTTLGIVLVIAALITRFGKDPNNVAPRTINAGFSAMTNIFNGAFRG
jgi:hypothetical protein